MRRMLHAAASVLLCLAGSGCEEELKPETVVDGLRVLGVRSEPAELRPGETAALEVLVLDPSRPGGPITVLWLACDPDPFDLGRSACSDPTVLQDPSTLAPAEGGAALPPGVRFVGFGPRATYTAPGTLFDVLPEGDPGRVTGTVAQLLLISVAEEVSPLATPDDLRALFERVQRKEVASLVTLFRVRVSEDAARNQNPAVGPLLVNGEPLPDGATVRLLPEAEVALDMVAPDSAFEVYVQPTPRGTVEERTERLLAAWYSTSGRFAEERLALRGQTPQRFTAPGSAKDPVPTSRRGHLYAVVRDTRGGQSFFEAPFYVCDAAAPVPSVTAVSPTEAAPGARVRLEGENLGALLEARVAGQVLRSGAANLAGTSFEAYVPPATPPGSHPLELLGTGCTDTTGPQLTVLPAP